MEHSNGVIDEKVIVDMRMQLARHEELIKNLCEWQKKQNGRLERLEEKFDRFLYLLLSAFVTTLLNLVLLLLKR